ncbi:hypothetical protein QTN25_004567 [Entamoeba marina]
MLHLLLFLAIAFASESDISCGSGYCTACSSDKCTACIDGYVLNVDDECVFFEDAHCSSDYKTTDERCYACASGYVLTSENNCIDCSSEHPDCTSIDGTACTADCNACGTYTYLNDNDECQNDDVHCTTYVNKVCTACTAFYYLDDSDVCQRGAIDNCYTYTSENECSSCLNDLLLNSDKTACGECSVEHCSTCYSNDFNKCSECETGYRTNTDEDECQLCTVSDCGICVQDTPTECSTCNSGYYTNTDKTECNVCVENCATCGSETTCTACNEGYYPSTDGTECIDCPDNCVECHKDDSDNIICDTCKYTSTDGYSYWRGDYTLNEDSTACISNIANCATYNAIKNNTCYECDSKYVEEDNVCNPCKVDRCTSCTASDSDLCYGCEDNYHVFTTTESVSSCVADITNCIDYDTTDGTTCTTCTTNYYPNDDGTACVTCITDSNHCTTCSADDTCTYCETGYIINSGNCDACSSHCLVCSAADTCTTCEDGYVINDDNECEACPSNCVQCDKSDTAKCEVCADGYFITEEYTCSACSSKCQTDILTTTSTTDDYTCNDAEYTCYVNQENHCARLSSDGSKCIQCESPYTLDEGKCYAYTVVSGYDGKDYVCLQYQDNTDEHEDESKLTEVYEPEDGECENKLVSEDGAFSVAIIAIISFIALLL